MFLGYFLPVVIRCWSETGGVTCFIVSKHQRGRERRREGGEEGGTEEEEESDHTSPPAMKRKVRLYSQINIGDVLTPGPVTVAKEDAGVTHKSLTRGMK